MPALHKWTYLFAQLKKTKEDDQLERKCNCLNEEFVSLKRKKQYFQSDIKCLKKIADNFAKRSEKELIITFIIKSNCLEDSLKKKKEKSIRKTYRLGDG